MILIFSFLYRFNQLVKLLIETHGASVDALSLAKKTPLHMAAEAGQLEVCSSLVKMDADSNTTDEVSSLSLLGIAPG